MAFFKRFDPREGVTDFYHEFRRPNPYRWPVLGASILLTGTLMFAFTQERVWIPPESPKVDYITSFRPDRTDAEIIASNIANQALKDERAARRAAIEERKRELYRSLGQATGMDVDEIERRAAEEQAAEEAAQAVQQGASGAEAADRSAPVADRSAPSTPRTQ